MKEMTVVERLKSRKTWLTIGGAAVPYLLQALTGAVSWPVAALASTIIVVAGILGIAAEDVARLVAQAMAKKEGK